MEIREFKTAERRILCLACCIIILLTAVAYGLSLRNGFVWDDEAFIVNNPFVRDISLWPQYFTNPRTISDEIILTRMYRPVQTLSFAVDSYLWGGRAGGFHFTSLILHVVSSIGIIFVFRNLVGLKAAATAACIFAVHPALSEGVLSLASRGNQLYTFFGLLCMGLFLEIRRPFDLRHLFSLIALAAALLSKEPAVIIVALLPLLQICSGKPWGIRTKPTMFLYLPYIAVTGFYLALRSLVVDTASVLPYWGGSLWATLLMQSKVFVLYLRLLVWPFLLKGRYSSPSQEPFADPFAAAATLFNIALIVTLVLLWRRGGRVRLLSLAAAWFYVSLLPVSNIIPLPGSMAGERFLYFTFAGVIPLLAGAFRTPVNKKVKNMVAVFGGLILVVFLVTDIARTSVWRDNKAFFTLLSEQEPDNHAVQVRMAQEELASGEVSSALKRLERITARPISAPLPQYAALPHYWYGKALIQARRFNEACREFVLVINIAPGSFKDSKLLLAECMANSGDLNGAKRLLEKETILSSEDDTLWNGLGNVLLMAGDVPGAIRAYRRALAINPLNSEAAANLRNAAKKDSR